MKKTIYNILAICLMALSTTGCSDSDKMEALPQPVPLKMELSSQSLVMGEKLIANFIVTGAADEKPVANEEFDIYLTAKSGTKDVSKDVFANFVEKVTFYKGENSCQVEIPIKEEGIASGIEFDLSAFARGYKIAGATQTVIVSDYRYVAMSLVNNADKEVKEGENFKLEARLGVAATEDLTIKITVKEGEENVYENMPTQLTIVAGKSVAESEPITIKKDGIYKGNIELGLLFETASTKHPLLEETMTIRMLDIDAPLGTMLGDERWVYNNPGIPFMSVKNKDAVEGWYNGELQEVKIGDPHPKKPEWKFYNAVEFHFIARSFSGGNEAPNQFGNHTPWCFAAQSTAAVQADQGVNNAKYSTITKDGVLKMWSVKEPTQATGGATGLKEYGTSAFYSSKFLDNNGANVTYAPQHTRIYPGMRIETRARIRGAKKGFNAAIWLQGIAQNKLVWPKYGEIDILENPAGPSEGMNAAYQTFHMGEDGTSDFNPHKKITMNNMSDWNIYWMEWVDDSTVKLGINGQENVTLHKSNLPAGVVWPFDKTLNPEGLYYILTLAAPSKWSLGSTIPAGWDAGFANISYSESKTHADTPRMELDWIRFYTNSVYDIGDRKSSYTHNNFYFY